MDLSERKKIRSIVRSIIQEVFNEAEETAHYTQRVAGRLRSIYTYPKFDYSLISDFIEIIRKTNFPANLSYAIKVKAFPKTENTTFNFMDPLTNKESVGNEVWAIVRGNKVTSIMFRNSGQGKFSKTPVDVYLEMDVLVKNYKFHIQNGNENEKGEVEFTLDGVQNKKVEEPKKFVNL